MSEQIHGPVGRGPFRDARVVLQRAAQLVRITADGGPDVVFPAAEEVREALRALDPAQLRRDDPALVEAMARVLFSTTLAGFVSVKREERIAARFGEFAVGVELDQWTRGTLDAFQVPAREIQRMDASEPYDSRVLVAVALAGGLVPLCLPKNTFLTACRNRDPFSETGYVTTIRAGGDFPSKLANVAAAVDPRAWQQADAFEMSVPAHWVNSGGNVDGDPNVESTPISAPHGQTWMGGLYERVLGSYPGSYMCNLLHVDFVTSPSFLKLGYKLWASRKGHPPNTQLHRDFGYLEAAPVLGQASWTRVELEKNVRFNALDGYLGGEVGWGDLPNLTASSTVAEWVADMCWLPCK